MRFFDRWKKRRAAQNDDMVIKVYHAVCEKCDDGAFMEKLNAAERVLYITQKLETEVNSGGFSQFFIIPPADSGICLYRLLWKSARSGRRTSARRRCLPWILILFPAFRRNARRFWTVWKTKRSRRRWTNATMRFMNMKMILPHGTLRISESINAFSIDFNVKREAPPPFFALYPSAEQEEPPKAASSNVTFIRSVLE